jgi:hypothetical protein
MQDSFLRSCELEIVPYIPDTLPIRTKVSLTTPERARFIQQVAEAMEDTPQPVSTSTCEKGAKPPGGKMIQSEGRPRRNLNFNSSYYRDTVVRTEKGEYNEASNPQRRNDTYQGRYKNLELDLPQNLTEWNGKDEKEPDILIGFDADQQRDQKFYSELLDSYDDIFTKTITPAKQREIEKFAARCTESNHKSREAESSSSRRPRLRLRPQTSPDSISMIGDERYVRPLRRLRLKSSLKSDTTTDKATEVSVEATKREGGNLPILGIPDLGFEEMLGKLPLGLGLDTFRSSPEPNVRDHRRRKFDLRHADFDDGSLSKVKRHQALNQSSHSEGVPLALVSGRPGMQVTEKRGDMVAQRCRPDETLATVVKQNKISSDGKKTVVFKPSKQKVTCFLGLQTAKELECGRNDCQERIARNRKREHDNITSPYQNDEESSHAIPKVALKHSNMIAKRPSYHQDSDKPTKGNKCTSSEDESPFAQVRLI